MTKCGQEGILLAGSAQLHTCGLRVEDCGGPALDLCCDAAVSERSCGHLYDVWQQAGFCVCHCGFMIQDHEYMMHGQTLVPT